MKQDTYYDFVSDEFLGLVEEQLDNETLKRKNARQLRFEDGVVYVTKEITGMGGAVDLITASTVEKKGTVNIDKARLPQLQNLILKGIRLSYGKKDNELDSAKVEYSPVKTGVDIALLRANLIIKQEDKVVFERPVADLMVDSLAEGAAQNTYLLENFRLIKADRQIEIKLEFPEGQSVKAHDATTAPARHHVEIRLFGAKTRVK